MRSYPLPLITIDLGTATTFNVVDKNRRFSGGMLFGNACAIDGLIYRINAELGQKATVVATGGYATAVIPHCETKISIDQNLLMKGLRSIYENNKSTGSPD